MNKHEKKEIENIQKFLLNELNEISNIRNTNIRLDRADILKNIFMITQNYTELEPVLKDFFEKKRNKEKWRDDR